MKGSFYIITQGTTTSPWYLLCDSCTHTCLACGKDIDVLMNTVTMYVKRYRTRYRFQEALGNLSHPTVNENTFTERQAYYNVRGKDYEDLISTVVDSALTEVRQEEKSKSPLKRTMHIKKVRTLATPPAPMEYCTNTTDLRNIEPQKHSGTVKPAPKVRKVKMLK